MRATRWLGRAAGVLLLWLLVFAASASAAEVRFGDGGWSWFQDPRAVTYTGDQTRTYVGWVTPAGDVTVGSYDHGTGQNASSVLHAALQEDDHVSPALHVRPDGRIVAFYARHSEAPMYYRVTTQPEDVTSWGPEQTITTNIGTTFGFTYPNPMRLAAENRTYLFWRGGSLQPSFSTQEDGSEEWAPARQLITVPGERPYVKYASNSQDTIHFAFTEAHPNEAPDKSTNIYYGRYRAGQIERVNGAPIAPLGTAITPAQTDKVFDETGPAWIHDIAVGADGRPVMVFASFPSSISRTGHRYHYARWTGTEWQVNEITPAGGSITTNTSSPLYSGGLTLAHEDPSRVYLSRQVGSAWWVEAWTTPDGGETWSSRTLTPGSTEKNVRPLSPRGAEPFGEMVVWMGGEYPNFLQIETRVTGFIEDPPGPAFPAPDSSAPNGGQTQAGGGGTAADLRTARVALPSRVRIGRRGQGLLSVRCRATASDRCLVKGSVRLRSSARSSASRIGTLRGVVPAGRRGNLRVRLTRRGLARLRRARILTARVTVTSVSRSGRRTRATGLVRLALTSR